MSLSIITVCSKARALVCAGAVLTLAAAAAAQSAGVPIHVSSSACVSITPPAGLTGAAGVSNQRISGSGDNGRKTFEISLGDYDATGCVASVRHGARDKANVPASVSYGRGNAALLLSPQAYGDAAVSLYRVDGRRVMGGKLSVPGAKLSLSRGNIPAGVYLLSVKGAKGSAFTSRLTHGGGKLNISASYGVAGGLSKSAASNEPWTITAEPNSGGSCPNTHGSGALTRQFCPTPGTNGEQSFNFTGTGGGNTCGETDMPEILSAGVYGEEFEISGTGTSPIKMKFVKGGTYTRGCVRDDANCRSDGTESPPHEVTLSSYYVSESEITIAQWAAVMDTTGSTSRGANAKSDLTWYEAMAFVCKLNAKTGRNFRMISDAEFEYAAKGGSMPTNCPATNGCLYSGSNTVGDVAASSGNVKQKAPNELGLYDMSGLNQEWVYDNWGNYPTSCPSMINPVVAHRHSQKVRRNGSGTSSTDNRVYARQIRSIDGDGAISVRLAISADGNMHPLMLNPCEVPRPVLTHPKKGFRDARLVTADDEAWMQLMEFNGSTFAYVLRVSANGTAVYSMVMEFNGRPMATGTVSGEWYTINGYSFNIVTSSGGLNRYLYMLMGDDRESYVMSFMSEGGMPARWTRTPISDVPLAAGVSLPTVSTAAAGEARGQALAREHTPNSWNIDMSNPPAGRQDPRIIDGPNHGWFQNNIRMGTGGTHLYRKDFNDPAANIARFAVFGANGSPMWLYRGEWYTVDNNFLIVDHNGRTHHYLYSVSATSDTLYHISYIDYEPLDFRMFFKEPNSDFDNPQWRWDESRVTGTTGGGRTDGRSLYRPPED